MRCRDRFKEVRLLWAGNIGTFSVGWGGPPRGSPLQSARVRDATCARALLMETPGPQHPCLDQMAPRAVLGAWTGARGFLSPVKTDTAHITPTVSLAESAYARMWPPPLLPASLQREETGHQPGSGGQSWETEVPPDLPDQDAKDRVAWRWPAPSASINAQTTTPPRPPSPPLMKMRQIQQPCSWLFTQKSWKLLSTENPHMDVCSSFSLN